MTTELRQTAKPADRNRAAELQRRDARYTRAAEMPGSDTVTTAQLQRYRAAIRAVSDAQRVRAARSAALAEQASRASALSAQRALSGTAHDADQCLHALAREACDYCRTAEQASAYRYGAAEINESDVREHPVPQRVKAGKPSKRDARGITRAPSSVATPPATRGLLKHQDPRFSGKRAKRGDAPSSLVTVATWQHVPTASDRRYVVQSTTDLQRAKGKSAKRRYRRALLASALDGTLATALTDITRQEATITRVTRQASEREHAERLAQQSLRDQAPAQALSERRTVETDQSEASDARMLASNARRDALGLAAGSSAI